MSISMITKSLLRQNGVRQAHVAPLHDCYHDVRVHFISFCGDSCLDASGVSNSPGRAALAYRGRLAARQGLTVGADWSPNRADLADQPE
eukprot:7213246-Alexandrium_andersonii.AAC.1